MAYLRIDDQAADHPKLEAVSAEAFRLWFRGSVYCQRYLTDGHIPAHIVRGFRGWSRAAQAELAKVFPPNRSALWHVNEDGSVEVHKYLEWNDSRDKVERLRADKATRQQAWRDRKKSDRPAADRDAPRDASTDASRDTPRDVSRDSAHNHSHNHNHSVAKATQGTASLVSRRNTKALNDSDAVQCPGSLRSEFEAVIATRIGPDDDAYTRLLTWTHEVSDTLVAEFGGVPQAFLEDAFKAWRQRLAQDWGIAAKPSAPATCRGRHKPPCADEATCTRRRREDDRQRVLDESKAAEDAEAKNRS